MVGIGFPKVPREGFTWSRRVRPGCIQISLWSDMYIREYTHIYQSIYLLQYLVSQFLKRGNLIKDTVSSMLSSRLITTATRASSISGPFSSTECRTISSSRVT